MKKVFIVLPLALFLANCSSTHNASGSSASSGTNGTNSSTMASTDMGSGTSGTDVTGSSSVGTTSGTGMNASGSASTNGTSGSASATTGGSGSMTTSGMTTTSTNTPRSIDPGYSSASTSANWNNNGSGIATSGTTNWDVYDPNNYMQNPDKYMRPDQLTKTGGWTYNKDWRRNTNFTPEAVGQWQLVLTPEVASAWMPDTRRPETYASFWTPEAVMGRYQASMAAAARTQDSLAALNATASTNTMGSGRRGRKHSSMTRGGLTASSGMNGGTWSSGSGTTGAVGSGGTSSMSTSGSGTTGTMGNSGSSSTTDMSATSSSSNGMNNNATIPFSMTAVNGNNFLLPTLNMYIDNGSFTAYTGCNDAVGTIVVNGSSLHFQEANPSTNVECIGGFDQSAFLDRLRRADSYDVVGNQFRLKQGDQVLMVFAKKNAQ